MHCVVVLAELHGATFYNSQYDIRTQRIIVFCFLYHSLNTPKLLTSAHAMSETFVEIDHEIFSTVILSLPLIQEGQLSVSGERMCTTLVNRLED